MNFSWEMIARLETERIIMYNYGRLSSDTVLVYIQKWHLNIWPDNLKPFEFSNLSQVN